jgi:hypothetical protein
VRRARVAGELAAGEGAQAEVALKPIGREGFAAEQRGELAVGDASRELELPQAQRARRIALAEQRAALGLGLDRDEQCGLARDPTRRRRSRAPS